MPTGHRHFEVLDKSPILLSRVRVTRVSLTMRVACVAGEALGSSGRKREQVHARETCVSPSRAPVFSCAHYFQAPAMQATMRGSEELKDNGKSHTVKPRYTRYLIITSLLCPW